MSYFQASVLVEHLIDAYGESTIHQMLRAWGDGLDTEEALARVGLDFDSLQASFDVAVEARFGELRRAMEGPEEAAPRARSPRRGERSPHRGSTPGHP